MEGVLAWTRRHPSFDPSLPASDFLSTCEKTRCGKFFLRLQEFGAVIVGREFLGQENVGPFGNVLRRGGVANFFLGTERSCDGKLCGFGSLRHGPDHGPASSRSREYPDRFTTNFLVFFGRAAWALLRRGGLKNVVALRRYLRKCPSWEAAGAVSEGVWE